MNKQAVSAVVVAAVVVSLVSAVPASAADWRFAAHAAAGAPKDVATGLLTPLSLAVDSTGVSYLSQNALGALTRVGPDGAVSTMAQAAPGEEIGAVSELGTSVYFYQGSQELGTARLMAVPKTGGEATQVADLGAYEGAQNPDQVNSYGFDGLPQSCLDQIAADGPVPAGYSGIVDSHPYATVATPEGVYVAEAGGNSILRAGYDGVVSTVAVLPPTAPVVATAELAAQAGLPDCVIGFGYRFEPVPTDIERGPDGWLYVSTLPGGPEGPTGGPRGAVYRVRPATGETVLVASGLTGPTGIAVSKFGVVMVAEIFGGAEGAGRVSLIVPGVSTPIGSLAVSSPAAIELRDGTVYVTRQALPAGPEEAAPAGVLTSVRLRGGALLW